MDAGAVGFSTNGVPIHAADGVACGTGRAGDLKIVGLNVGTG